MKFIGGYSLEGRARLDGLNLLNTTAFHRLIIFLLVFVKTETTLRMEFISRDKMELFSLSNSDSMKGT